MADITETRLPGVGTRFELACAGGRQVGVITRHSGRRELIVYDARDPDAVAATVELSADESRTLAELLGGGRITEQLRSAALAVEGLAIDWLTVPAGFTPRTIGATELRSQTGVSIIALVRGEVPIPAPGPETVVQPGDVAVVTGTAEGIAAAERLLGG
jgi:TrkA domain protein